MHFILVAYHFNADKQEKWRRFLASFPGATSVVIENADGATSEASSLVQGSNRHFEFSGYLEGMEASSLEEEDPYWVILNDTLFSHHWALGWRHLIARVSLLKDGIYGDYRREPILWDGRPLDLYASWIFMVKGPLVRLKFQVMLKEVLSMFDTPLNFPGYEVYQQRYMRATLWSGYTSILHPAKHAEALQIKKQCIHAEHRLGRTLDNLGWVNRLPGPTYTLVHAVDRWLSFKRRATRLLIG